MRTRIKAAAVTLAALAVVLITSEGAQAVMPHALVMPHG
jgi:hypothetical protein